MTILVDASALISLFSEKDQNHNIALNISRALKNQSLLISNYIFAEVVTMLSQRQGKTKSISVGDYIKKNYISLSVDVKTEDLAWEIFKAQRSKNVSFVDCTSFALFKKGFYDKAFSFDADFKKNKIPVLSA